MMETGTMTAQSHNTAVANERPAVEAQDPVASGSKDRRLYSVSMHEDGCIITHEAPYTQEAGIERTEWDGPYDGVLGRFIIINAWGTSWEDAQQQALQVPQNLF